VVVGSAEGGLAEAIGPCGVTFPNGDVRALANALSRLLEDPVECHRLRANAAAHLARFTPRFVAGLYLDAMKNASR
jgi:glycosyltransferase involved in cell wall biosynthesis